MSRCLILIMVLVFLSAFTAPAAAQIQDCICNEIGGGPPGFPPHPFMTPVTMYECVMGDVVATLVFNRPVANTVVTRGAFPGFSGPNPQNPCGPHQGLRLAATGSPLGTGVAPIAATELASNTVQLRYDGTDPAVQALIAVLPANLQVSATYFPQPHLVDQGELLCIQIIKGVDCLEECAQIVDRDIKPGSCPNPLNPSGGGYIPMSILGTDDFDVTQIVVGSILLSRMDGVGGSVSPNEGPRGPHSVVEDAGTPFDGELCDCHELEGDGIPDLSMKFKRKNVVAGLELDDLSEGTVLKLVVSGDLSDGTRFNGADCIVIVGGGG